MSTTTADTVNVDAAAATPDRAAPLDLRGDFPILGREIAGKPLVYLDTAATAQKPAAVIDAERDFYMRHNSNVHRGVYVLAQEATDMFEGARARIAAFVGGDPATTIFTANGSAAINLVAYAWGAGNVRAGDAVLVTEMEHHSNLVPWQQLCLRMGAQLRYLDVDDDGRLSLQQLERELARGDVRLCAFAHISNVLGTINPVKEMAALCAAAGVLTVVDGCQAVPQLPVDLAQLGVDFYAWTGHKAVGPTGIGVLHGRAEILEAMDPFMTGGHMISAVSRERSTWAQLPWKFEAGTSQIAEAIGLGVAVDYLSSIGMERVREHELALTAATLDGLNGLDGVRVIGPPGATDRGGVVSFQIDGIHPHDVAELLNRDNVCVRAGHHCAQVLMARLGVSATARASFGPYNVSGDVQALVDSVARAQAVFAG